MRRPRRGDFRLEGSELGDIRDDVTSNRGANIRRCQHYSDADEERHELRIKFLFLLIYSGTF